MPDGNTVSSRFGYSIRAKPAGTSNIVFLIQNGRRTAQ
jgi:hypothetical protein